MALLAGSFVTGAARATAAAWEALVPQARLQGTARLTWLGLHVYDARLWVAPGFAAAQPHGHAFALELTYARAFRGRDIAGRSLTEMRRAGEIESEVAGRWEAELAALLPDVKPGDRITGVHRPGRGASFFVNDRHAGDIADARFAERFFSIWLGAHTSQPAMRANLLGLS